jgi:hypothetical protein
MQTISDGTRRRSSDPISCFEVRTAGGRLYLMQAKSSGGERESAREREREKESERS